MHKRKGKKAVEKMTKERMSRYYWLSHEIKRQERRLERLACSKSMNELETDVVFGSEHQFPYIETKFKITGKPVGIIHKIEEDIKKSVEEAIETRNEVASFIDTLDNPKLREILRSRFIDCLKWDDVGKQNFISPDHARKIVREFLQKLN